MPRPLKLAYLTMAPPVPAQSGYAVRLQTIGEALAGSCTLRFLVLGQDADRAAVAATRERFAADFVLAPPRKTAMKLPTHLRAVLTNRVRWVEKYRTGALRTAALRALDHFAPDYVILGSLAFADLPAAYGIGADRVIVDHHNVETVNYARMRASRRGFGRLEAGVDGRAFGRSETIAKGFFEHWAVSDTDRSLLETILGRKVVTVPNVAPDRAFAIARTATPEAPPLVGFLGNYHYYPNVEAALEFCDVIGQMRDRGLTLGAVATGRDPPPSLRRAARSTGVELPGFIDDPRELFARLTIMLAPIRSGAGTKLKIVEALAMGLPVVTTPVGAEGLPIAEEGLGVVAKTNDALARAVATLLADRSGAAAMGARARTWAQRSASVAALRTILDARLTALHARRGT